MARFIYYNRNPDGDTESDCVTRAISLASGLPYQEIRKKLYHVSKLYNCERLCVCCYRHLLDDIFEYERVNGEGYLVGDFADLNPYGIYLLRVDGHLTISYDGDIYDIWDCRNSVITDAWRVK